MRDTRRTVLGGALGVMLGALPVAGAGAQLPIPDVRYQQPPAIAATLPRPTAVESHFTRIRMDGGSGRRTADGVGVRLVFGHRLLEDDSEPRTLVHRTELALFATHAREPRAPHDARLTTTTAGIAADLRPLAEPIAGRLEPFVSLGAGVLRTSDSELAPPFTLRWPPQRIERTHASAALLPGIGARLLVTPRIAVQAEAHDLWSLGPRTHHDIAMGTGLRVAL